MLESKQKIMGWKILGTNRIQTTFHYLKSMKEMGYDKWRLQERRREEVYSQSYLANCKDLEKREYWINCKLVAISEFFLVSFLCFLMRKKGS